MNGILSIESLTMRFAGLVAVSNFNLILQKNELVGLIGPNGAGKTTVFNMLTGVYRPSEGEIRLQDDILNECKPHEITERGMTRMRSQIPMTSLISCSISKMVRSNCFRIC